MRDLRFKNSRFKVWAIPIKILRKVRHLHVRVGGEEAGNDGKAGEKRKETQRKGDRIPEVQAIHFVLALVGELRNGELRIFELQRC